MNYINEFDRSACAILLQLISDGLIPPAEVDCRDIREVTANDLKGFTQVHLFGGIAGWLLACEYAGFTPDRQIWTASCPCPPFSCAGKKKACPACGGSPIACPRRTGYFICIECECAWHADERHLWPEVWRLIRDGRPAIIVGEQVASEDGRIWLAGIRASMEALDYAVGASDLCAAGVGTPHIRQRIWWGAVQSSRLGVGQPRRLQQCDAQQRILSILDESGALGEYDDLRMADAGCEPDERWGVTGIVSGAAGSVTRKKDQRERSGDAAGDCGAVGGMADTASSRCLGEIRESETTSRNEARLLGPRADSATRGVANPESGRHARPDAGSPSGEEVDGRQRVLRVGGHSASSGVADANGGQSGDGELQPGWEHGLQSEDGGADKRLANAASGGLRADRSPSGESGHIDKRGALVNGDIGLVNGDIGLVNTVEQGLEGHSGDVENGSHPGWIGADEARPTPASDWSDSRWVLCYDKPVRKWRRVPLERTLFPLAYDGKSSTRVGLLRGSGNAIVPRLGSEFLLALEEAVKEVAEKKTAAE